MNLNSFLHDGDTFGFMNRGFSLGMRYGPMTMTKESEELAASALSSLYAAPSSSYRLTLEQAKTQMEIPQLRTKNGRRKAVSFPLKLMKVLSDENNAHIITWMPGGRSFVIIRPKAFVKDILPRHFKPGQYASFTRKLTRWGFLRCEDGTGEFRHPQFRKGRVDLAEDLSCNVGDGGKFHDAKEENSKDKCAPNGPSLVPSPDNASSERSAVSSSHHSPQRLLTKPIASDISPLTKEEAFAIELEALKFQKTVRMAAASRIALAKMQTANSFARHPLRGSRAFALAGGGLFQGLHQMDHHTSRANMLLSGHDMGMQLSPLDSEVDAYLRRKANFFGAKTA